MVLPSDFTERDPWGNDALPEEDGAYPPVAPKGRQSLAGHRQIGRPDKDMQI